MELGTVPREPIMEIQVEFTNGSPKLLAAANRYVNKSALVIFNIYALI